MKYKHKEIAKMQNTNSTEIRISESTELHTDTRKIDIRLWYEDKMEYEYKPTKQGLRITPESALWIADILKGLK